MAVALDVANLWNQKRLHGSYNNGEDYTKYIFERRLAGDDVKYGDKSTFDILTQPYLTGAGVWHRPVDARTDWLQHRNPRYYRFSARFNL